MLNENTYTIIWQSASFSTFAGVLLFLSEMRQSCRAGFFASPLHPAFTKQPRVIKHGNGKNMAMAKELNLIQFADSTFLFKSMDGDFRLSALLEGLWQPADVKILLSWSFMTSRQPTMPSVATMRRKALCWPPLIQTFARIWPCCKRSLECLAIFVDQFSLSFFLLMLGCWKRDASPRISRGLSCSRWLPFNFLRGLANSPRLGVCFNFNVDIGEWMLQMLRFSGVWDSHRALSNIPHRMKKSRSFLPKSRWTSLAHHSIPILSQVKLGEHASLVGPMH